MPGLGKNSPIILSQSRGNFEALIERHGQWLRWRIAKKCPCVTENNRHDIHCEKCGGAGDIYDCQREYDDVYRATVRDNIIELPKEYGDDARIIEILDSKAGKFQFCRCGEFIQIINGTIPNGELVDVKIRVPLVKRLETVVLEKVGRGYYRVPGILTEPSPIEGVSYQAAGDVIAIAELKDEDKNPVNILGYRRDMVIADTQTETLTAYSVEYVMPVRFLVLSQNLSKADADFVEAHQGSAVCTYPYIYNLSANDALTVLSGSMTQKIVIAKRGDGIDDTIPEFFVAQIDCVETKTAAYAEGVDFILIGANKLHWMGSQPEAGEIMSITYRYHPTFRVTKEIPMLRTSEDQRMPRKVALNLFSGFGEAKGVNRQ